MLKEELQVAITPPGAISPPGNSKPTFSEQGHIDSTDKRRFSKSTL